MNEFKIKEDFFKNVGCKVTGFKVLSYSVTDEGDAFDKADYGYDADETPNFLYQPNVNILYPPTLDEVMVTLTIPVLVLHKKTGAISPLLATIKTRSTYLFVGIENADRDEKTGFPPIVLKVLMTDAMTATRGAFSVKNVGSSLTEAIIPMGSNELAEAQIVPKRPYSTPESEERASSSDVEVIFDLNEDERELMPGHVARPTYGIDVINHKPYPIRVTDHYMELLEKDSWKKIDHVFFHDKADRHEYEQSGQPYVEYLRKLPKTLKPNERFLWNIMSFPLDKDAQIRGVIVADKKKYYSEPYNFKSPSRQARAQRILNGEEG